MSELLFGISCCWWNIDKIFCATEVTIPALLILYQANQSTWGEHWNNNSVLWVAVLLLIDRHLVGITKKQTFKRQFSWKNQTSCWSPQKWVEIFPSEYTPCMCCMQSLPFQQASRLTWEVLFDQQRVVAHRTGAGEPVWTRHAVQLAVSATDVMTSCGATVPSWMLWSSRDTSGISSLNRVGVLFHVQLIPAALLLFSGRSWKFSVCLSPWSLYTRRKQDIRLYPLMLENWMTFSRRVLHLGAETKGTAV